jgi:hypothetical protein
VALIAHADLHTLLTRYPDIKDLFWRDTLLQAAISQAWIIGLGRRSARARLAHLFCELFCRLAAIGLANRTRCSLRLTQADLGDALGLSTVHINRTLQELRSDGLLSLESGCLTIHNWDRLAATAGFDPAYLNLATCQTDSMLPSLAHNRSLWRSRTPFRFVFASDVEERVLWSPNRRISSGRSQIWLCVPIR